MPRPTGGVKPTVITNNSIVIFLSALVLLITVTIIPSQTNSITQFAFTVPKNIAKLDGVRYTVNNTYSWIYHDILIKGTNFSPSNNQTYDEVIPTYDIRYFEPFDRMFAIKDNTTIGHYVKMCVDIPNGTRSCQDTIIREHAKTDPVAWGHFFNYQ